MSYRFNEPIDLTPTIASKYMIVPQHRGSPTEHKSVWTISNQEEISCFTNSVVSRWKCDKYHWGVSKVNGVIIQLGTNYENHVLQIAKFVDSSCNDCWHGYPANLQRHPGDIPSMAVLNLWQQSGIISKSEKSKIKGGKRCIL